MNTYITTQTSNQTTTLTLNRPELHNAFDENFIAEFTEILKKIDQDENTRVLIINANGKSFCAGADLKWMQKMADYSREENIHDAMQLAQLMQTLNDLSKPTIALVHGAAFGGGAGLVACCDIVLATPEASFCFSEVKLGLIPAVISPYVINAIGAQQTRRYFLTAEKFSADVAMLIGLVHEVVAAENLEQTATKILQTILQNGPQAISKAKQLIRDVTNKNIDEKLIRHTAECIADIRISEEGQEGLQAFLQKRAAKWIN